MNATDDALEKLVVADAVLRADLEVDELYTKFKTSGRLVQTSWQPMRPGEEVE